jgi:Holliday junction resolvase-like predicted endonuclease
MVNNYSLLNSNSIPGNHKKKDKVSKSLDLTHANKIIEDLLSEQSSLRTRIEQLEESLEIAKQSKRNFDDIHLLTSDKSNFMNKELSVLIGRINELRRINYLQRKNHEYEKNIEHNQVSFWEHRFRNGLINAIMAITNNEVDKKILYLFTTEELKEIYNNPPKIIKKFFLDNSNLDTFVPKWGIKPVINSYKRSEIENILIQRHDVTNSFLIKKLEQLSFEALTSLSKLPFIDQAKFLKILLNSKKSVWNSRSIRGFSFLSKIAKDNDFNKNVIRNIEIQDHEMLFSINHLLKIQGVKKRDAEIIFHRLLINNILTEEHLINPLVDLSDKELELPIGFEYNYLSDRIKRIFHNIQTKIIYKETIFEIFGDFIKTQGKDYIFPTGLDQMALDFLKMEINDACKGFFGELAAAYYYQQALNMEIFAFRVPILNKHNITKGEIDIIAVDPVNKTIWDIEVKNWSIKSKSTATKISEKIAHQLFLNERNSLLLSIKNDIEKQYKMSFKPFRSRAIIVKSSYFDQTIFDYFRQKYPSITIDIIDLMPSWLTKGIFVGSKKSN